jgi:hypothetical protein
VVEDWPSPALTTSVSPGDKDGYLIAWHVAGDGAAAAAASPAPIKCRPVTSQVTCLAASRRSAYEVAVGYAHTHTLSALHFVLNFTICRYQNGAVCLVDMMTGAISQRFGGHAEEVQHVAWNPARSAGAILFSHRFCCLLYFPNRAQTRCGWAPRARTVRSAYGACPTVRHSTRWRCRPPVNAPPIPSDSGLSSSFYDRFAYNSPARQGLDDVCVAPDGRDDAGLEFDGVCDVL